jgi:hypothetical protein
MIHAAAIVVWIDKTFDRSFPLCPTSLMSTTVTSILPTLEAIYIQKTRQPRKGCQYTREELAVLNNHKAEYRKKTTHADRVQILRNAIFVDIFNYWDHMQVPLDETEIRQRMKVCIITGYLNYLSNSKSEL